MQENSKEISAIKQRILQYLEFKGISQYKCYKETGISKNVLGQPNGISEENLLKFLNNYKDVDPSWLVLGEKSMLREKNTDDLNDPIINEKIRLTEVTPEFILNRYEQLVIENNELRNQLKDQKMRCNTCSQTNRLLWLPNHKLN